MSSHKSLLEAQLQVEKELTTWKEISRQLQEAEQQKQKLQSQKKEQALIQKEFEFLNDKDQLFQLTGPMLLPIQLRTASQQVEKKSKYVDQEM